MMNPWQIPQHFYSPVSSHYAQALLQNPQGWFQQQTLALQTSPSHSAHAAPCQARPRPQGAHRCTYDQCTFSGSQQAMETHMMDRHLIYPPNLNRVKQHSWDADPSLKGKSIVIQGTNVTLNTPEDIEAWIAERKKRFPTANRVADKKANLEKAIARGQLPFDDNPRFPKRPRFEEPNRGAKRGRGRGRNRRRRDGPSARRDVAATSNVSTTPIHTAPDLSSPQPASPARSPAPVLLESYGYLDSDDAPPEALSVRTLDDTVPEPFEPLETPRGSKDLQIEPSTPERPTELRRRSARQPRVPPSSSFGQSTPLLRNLLSSEVRNTISNLSQALRFLVDNDFLENVELTSGDAERRNNRIRVLSSTEDPNESE